MSREISIFLTDVNPDSPTGPRPFVRDYTLPAWEMFAARESVEFLFATPSHPRRCFHKWYWTEFLPESDLVLLVDSDTLPSPDLTRQHLETLAGQVNTFAAAVCGDPVLHYQRMLPWARVFQLHDWTDAVNGGVWVIHDRPDTRAVSRRLLAASDKHSVPFEEDFAQLFLTHSGFPIERLSRRWNFTAMSNPLLDLHGIDYRREMGLIWHFCGLQKHLIPSVYQRYYGKEMK